MGKLSALEPDGNFKTLMIRGRTLEVRPLIVDRMPAFIRHAAPLIPAFFRMRKTGTGDESADEIVQILHTVEENLSSVKAALGAALDEAADDIGQLTAGELVQAFCAVMDANLDFFTRQATPAIIRLARTLIQVTPASSLQASRPP